MGVSALSGRTNRTKRDRRERRPRQGDADQVENGSSAANDSSPSTITSSAENDSEALPKQSTFQSAVDIARKKAAAIKDAKRPRGQATQEKNDREDTPSIETEHGNLPASDGRGDGDDSERPTAKASALLHKATRGLSRKSTTPANADNSEDGESRGDSPVSSNAQNSPKKPQSAFASKVGEARRDVEAISKKFRRNAEPAEVSDTTDPSLEKGPAQPVDDPSRHIALHAWRKGQGLWQHCRENIVPLLVGIHITAHYGNSGAKHIRHWLSAVLIFLLALTSFVATLVAAGSLAVVISPYAPESITPDFFQHEFYFLRIKLPEPVTFVPNMHNYYQLGPFGNAIGDRQADSITSWPTRGMPVAPDPTSYLVDDGDLMDIAKSLFMSVAGDVTSAAGSVFNDVTSNAAGAVSTMTQGAVSVAGDIADTGKNAGNAVKGAFGFKRRDLASVLQILSNDGTTSESDWAVALKKMLEDGNMSAHDTITANAETSVDVTKTSQASIPSLIEARDPSDMAEAERPEPVLEKRDGFKSFGSAVGTTFTGIGDKALEAARGLLKSVEEAFEKLVSGFKELRKRLANTQKYIRWFEYALLGLLCALGFVICCTILANFHWGCRQWARLEQKRIHSNRCAWIPQCCCFWKPDDPREQDHILKRAHGHGLIGLIFIGAHVIASISLLVIVIPATIFALLWVVIGSLITATNVALQKLPLSAPYDFNLSVSKWTLMAAVATAGGIIVAIVTSPVLMSWAWRYMVFILTSPFRIVWRIWKLITYPFEQTNEGCHDIWQAFRDIPYRFGAPRAWVTNPDWKPQEFKPAFARTCWRGPWIDMKRWWFKTRYCWPIFLNKRKRGGTNIRILTVHFMNHFRGPHHKRSVPEYVPKDHACRWTPDLDKERLQEEWEFMERYNFTRSRGSDGEARGRCRSWCCSGRFRPTTRPRHNARFWQNHQNNKTFGVIPVEAPPDYGEFPPAYVEFAGSDAGARQESPVVKTPPKAKKRPSRSAE